MSGDRQDFLERQEARRRRMQQRLGQPPPSDRLPHPAEADNKATGRQSKRQALVARGKPGKAQPTGQAAKARTLPPQTGDPADQDGAQADGLKGRRAPALREGLAGRTAMQRGPKPPLLPRLIIWGTAAICGLLILATLGEVWTVHLLNQQIAANEQTNQQLQGQNQQISSSIQQLQQASTIEQEARKLGFIFPGDQPVIVVTTSPQGASAPQATPPSSGWWGFWPEWFKLFFGG